MKLDLLEETLRVSAVVSRAKTEDEQTMLLAGELVRVTNSATAEVERELVEARQQLDAARERIVAMRAELDGPVVLTTDEEILAARSRRVALLADTSQDAEAYKLRDGQGAKVAKTDSAPVLAAYVDAAMVARRASKVLERERGEEAAFGAAYVSSQLLSRAAELRGGK